MVLVLKTEMLNVGYVKFRSRTENKAGFYRMLKILFATQRIRSVQTLKIFPVRRANKQELSLYRRKNGNRTT